jgi:hypothetical protein
MVVGYCCICLVAFQQILENLGSGSGVVPLGLAIQKGRRFCIHVTTTFFSGQIIPAELVSLSSLQSWPTFGWQAGMDFAL